MAHLRHSRCRTALRCAWRRAVSDALCGRSQQSRHRVRWEHGRPILGHWHMQLRTCLCAALLVGCGGLVADDSLGGSSTSDALDAAPSEGGDCSIPIGSTVGLSVGGSCVSWAPLITLLPNGYTSDLWSCNSATYHGCTVTYSNCTTPDGGPVPQTNCTPISMTVTFGSSCGGSQLSGLIACGSSQWACSVNLPCSDVPVDITKEPLTDAH